MKLFPFRVIRARSKVMHLVSIIHEKKKDEKKSDSLADFKLPKNVGMDPLNPVERAYVSLNLLLFNDNVTSQ